MKKLQKNYNKAIELDPNYANAYIGRGGTYGYLSQYERSIEDFNKAIELDPDNAEAYNNRGAAYFYLNQYERAIEDFNKTIELYPNHNKAYNSREMALNKLGDKKGVPGFESIFAITGLLAVTYLLRRRK